MTKISARTNQAINRQLKAMGCLFYSIGVRNAVTGVMFNIRCTQEDIIKSIPFFKHKNASGCDIYIKPADDETHSLILIDDVSLQTIKNMIDSGEPPALTVETSPNNYQAWLKLSYTPIALSIRSVIARLLAQKYNADKASADGRHYGRLSGFTNQKPKYRDLEGKQPWVLCRSSSGVTIDDRAKQVLLQQAEAQLLIKEHPNTPHLYKPVKNTRHKRDNSIQEFSNEMNLALTLHPDISQCDFIVASIMAKKGWSQADIEYAMLNASPNICERKKGHIDNYIRRTVKREFDKI